MVKGGTTGRDSNADRTSPESVLSSERLLRAQKIEMLLSWAYDAAEEEVAEEEGMPGAADHLLGRILSTLHTLTGNLDVERVAPSKQHGLSSSSLLRSQ